MPADRSPPTAALLAIFRETLPKVHAISSHHRRQCMHSREYVLRSEYQPAAAPALLRRRHLLLLLLRPRCQCRDSAVQETTLQRTPTLQAISTPHIATSTPAPQALTLLRLPRTKLVWMPAESQPPSAVLPPIYQEAKAAHAISSPHRTRLIRSRVCGWRSDLLREYLS